MINFKEAGIDYKDELTSLWRTCFCEEMACSDYFYKNLFNGNCYIAEADGKLAAALYLLPCKIVTPSGSLDAHYLFGAGTHPEHRGKGIMGSLIEHSNAAAFKKGQLYSILLPASDSLYGFYSKLGYMPYYKIDRLVIDRHMSLASTLPVKMSTACDSSVIKKIRDCRLGKGHGNLLPSLAHTQYALMTNSFYGGVLIRSDSGYALCGKPCDGTAVVSELICAPEEADSLIAGAFEACNAEKLIIRMPAGAVPAANGICRTTFGMLRHTLPGDSIDWISQEPPYLGLTLD